MKKKLILAVCIILAIFLLLVATVFIGLGVITLKGYGITQGRVLITDNGSYMIIDENNGPIVMSNRSKNEELFADLTSGDEILIVNGLIEETYPAGTGVYYCIKLSDGEYADLPEKTLLSLTEMGWISNSNPIDTDSVKISGELVTVEQDGKMLSLIIPDGWEYSTSNAMDFSSEPFIEFWPEGEDEGRIKFMYDDAFGVCGTGLECEDITLGGNTGSMGTYDNDPVWTFIAFDSDYHIWNYGADKWWNEHGAEAMEILDTINYR